jgi:hypothetical protein
MRSVREGFELIFVAVFADFTTHIISSVVVYRFDFTGFDRLRRAARGEPHDSDRQRAAKEERLDDSVWTQSSPSL